MVLVVPGILATSPHLVDFHSLFRIRMDRTDSRYLTPCTWKGPILSGIIAASLCLLLLSQSDAALSRRESHYQIQSRGFNVGELKTVMQPTEGSERLIHFESTTTVHAIFLVFGFNSKSHEEALVGEHGTLRYRLKASENGRVRVVNAHYDHGRFTLVVKEDQKSRTLIIPRDQYDYTTMDCPEMKLAREGDHSEIRLLNLEQARVVTRRYHWVRTEAVKVGNRLIHCRVIEFEDPDNRCTRWVSTDDMGVVIVRQEGKGRGGSYVLKMTDLTAS